jgi:hypothetical protein
VPLRGEVPAIPIRCFTSNRRMNPTRSYCRTTCASPWRHTGIVKTLAISANVYGMLSFAVAARRNLRQEFDGATIIDNDNATALEILTPCGRARRRAGQGRPAFPRSACKARSTCTAWSLALT